MTNIRDIANKAGVSIATVSRTLSHPDIVREKTRAKVEAAIAELGYSPNAWAKQLRRMQSETVIVIVPDISNPFYAGIVQGIENVAHDEDFKILLGETQGEQERLDHYAGMVATRLADGIILMGPLMPTVVEKALKAGETSPIPLVVACDRFEGRALHHVGIDNVRAAKDAVDHLVSLGRKRIATIAGPRPLSLSKDRTEGYRQSLTAAGLPFDEGLVVEGDFTVGSGAEAMEKLLALPDRPDAVFCANDEMAFGAQQAIRRAGLKMPEDIAIIGFDDIRFAEFAEPPLSSIRQPTVEIGSTAMRIMLDLLFDRPAAEDQSSQICGHRLVVRESSSDT